VVHSRVHAAVDAATSGIEVRARIDTEPVVEPLVERRQSIGLAPVKTYQSKRECEHT
jgi:hypothetical protein